LSFKLLEFGRRHRPEMSLHRRHLRADLLLELSSFVWRHRSEEGLHLFHFGQLLVGRLGTVSGVVSFPSTPITRSSYVYSVSPSWRVNCLRGAQSTGRRVGCLWARLYVLAYPSQERSSPGCHVVVCAPCAVSSQHALSFGIFRRKRSQV